MIYKASYYMSVRSHIGVLPPDYPRRVCIEREMLHFQRLPDISLKIVPSETALPLCSPHRTPIETFRFQSLLYLSLKVLGEGAPTRTFPHRGPYGERCPFPEPSLTYLSESVVKELSSISKSAVKEPPSMFP